MCRALVFNNVAEILVLIVVIAFGRLDFDDRQSLAAQHGNRKFPPEPTLFDEHLGIKSQRLGQRLPDFVNRRTLELKNPHRRAFARGFHNNVAPECVQNLLSLIGARSHKPFGNRDARLRPDAARRVLVHRKRTGTHTCTRVRDLQVFQNTLHAAVFTEASVQRNHRSIVLSAQRHEVGLSRINFMCVASCLLQGLEHARAT